MIQSYGLDEFKTGGFFTMKFKVYGCGSLLSHHLSPLRLLDARIARQLVCRAAPSLEKQWLELINKLDGKTAAWRQTCKESDVCASLKSYFIYGKTRTCL